MSNWKTVRLGDVFEFNPRESISKGTVAKKIAMDCLVPYCREISDFEFAAFSGGAKFRNGDTLMARITPCLENGKTALVRILDDEEIGFGSTEYIVFREKKGISNKYFIYYFVTNPAFRDIAVKSMVGSSGRQRVQQSVLENLEISLPSLAKQGRIAGILGALDDKIECNNRINRNLEEQAAVLFRSWFVDFEFPDPDPTSPTYGKPYRSAGGTMQDSPLGPIPKGWKVGRLSDCTAYISRGITPKYVEIGKEIVLNQKCIRNHDVSFNESRFHTPKVINDKWLKFGDILINSTGQGTLGRVAQFFYNNNNVTVDSHVSIVRPIADNCIHFIGQALIGREAEIESMAAGSTGQTELPRERLNNMEIIMPGNTVLNRFHTAISPFMKMKIKNRLENQALKRLRDTLLPKLMNNEIII